MELDRMYLGGGMFIRGLRGLDVLSARTAISGPAARGCRQNDSPGDRRGFPAI